MTISTDGKGGSTGHEEAGGGEAGGTRRDFGNQVGGIGTGGVLAGGLRGGYVIQLGDNELHGGVEEGLAGAG